MRNGASLLMVSFFCVLFYVTPGEYCSAQEPARLVVADSKKEKSQIKASPKKVTQAKSKQIKANAKQSTTKKGVSKGNTKTLAKSPARKRVSLDKPSISSTNFPKKLDLTLPREFAYRSAEQVSGAESASNLLPSMFDNKSKKLSPYQLSGKLITNERGVPKDADYWETVDGAELSIEFRN